MEQRIGVGRVGKVLFSFRKAAHAGVIAFPVLHVNYNLKMQVRRPLPVFGRCAKSGKPLSFFNCLPFLDDLD